MIPSRRSPSPDEPRARRRARAGVVVVGLDGSSPASDDPADPSWSRRARAAGAAGRRRIRPIRSPSAVALRAALAPSSPLRLASELGRGRSSPRRRVPGARSATPLEPATRPASRHRGRPRRAGRPARPPLSAALLAVGSSARSRRRRAGAIAPTPRPRSPWSASEPPPAVPAAPAAAGDAPRRPPRPSPPRRAARTSGSGISEADPVADRRAVPGRSAAAPRRARADRGRDLLVGVALERAAHERLALGLGQCVDGAHHPRQLVVGERDLGRLADAVDLLGRAARAGARRGARSAPGCGRSCRARASGCISPVESRSASHERTRLSWTTSSALRRRVGGRERDQRRAVPAHDLLERRVAALARERDQASSDCVRRTALASGCRSRSIRSSARLSLRTARGVWIDLDEVEITPPAAKITLRASLIGVLIARTGGPPTSRLSSAADGARLRCPRSWRSPAGPSRSSRRSTPGSHG